MTSQDCTLFILLLMYKYKHILCKSDFKYNSRNRINLILIPTCKVYNTTVGQQGPMNKGTQLCKKIYN